VLRDDGEPPNGLRGAGRVRAGSGASPHYAVDAPATSADPRPAFVTPVDDPEWKTLPPTLGPCRLIAPLGAGASTA
jgi:hypothetical protein